MIRLAEENDLPEIMRLLHQLNPDDPVIANGRDKAIFQQILQNPHLRLFANVLAGQIVSTCYLNIIPNLTRNASPCAVIENVVTESALRNRGHGQAVVKFALDYAWKAGCYKVMLLTGRKEESVHKFYESCGFAAGKKTAFLAGPPGWE